MTDCLICTLKIIFEVLIFFNIFIKMWDFKYWSGSSPKKHKKKIFIDIFVPCTFMHFDIAHGRSCLNLRDEQKEH